MSVLYLHFDNPDRPSRLQKLVKSGAHIVVTEPRWPMFFELAKKEKPYAIAIDFSRAPSHALETADYLAKARETREVSIYLLRVPEDRLEAVKRRLPQAALVNEQELSDRLAVAEKEAEERAREKKEAAAAARKSARARKAAEKGAAAGKPPARTKKAAERPKKAAAGKAARKSSSRPRKKK